jgi:preprotein translocase subunit SecB
MSEIEKKPQASLGAIQLVSFRIREVEFKHLADTPEDDPEDFEIESMHRLPDQADEGNKNFATFIRVSFVEKTHGYRFSASIMGEFQAGEEVHEEFLTKPMVRVNSSAILFPFLRAFVASFTATAGFPAIVLPAVNFLSTFGKR